MNSQIYLNSVFIELLSDCNFKCLYCYNAQISSSKIPVEVLNRVISQAKKLGCKKIILSGGEPFLYPEFEDTLANIFKSNMELVIVTNGSLITEENISCLKGYDKLIIRLSRDSIDNAVNSRTRKGAERFDFLKCTSLLSSAHIPVEIKCTITRINMYKVDEIIDFCTEWGFKPAFGFAMSIGSYMESGNLILNEMERVKLTEQINNKLLKVNARFIPYKCNCSLMEEKGLMDILIRSTGSIQPCQWLCDNKFSLGSIYTNDLEDILHMEKTTQLLNTIKKSRMEFKGQKCVSCFLYNKCAGGCAACSWSENGTLYRDDGGCLIRRTMSIWESIHK